MQIGVISINQSVKQLYAQSNQRSCIATHTPQQIIDKQNCQKHTAQKALTLKQLVYLWWFL